MLFHHKLLHQMRIIIKDITIIDLMMVKSQDLIIEIKMVIIDSKIEMEIGTIDSKIVMEIEIIDSKIVMETEITDSKIEMETEIISSKIKMVIEITNLIIDNLKQERARLKKILREFLQILKWPKKNLLERMLELVIKIKKKITESLKSQQRRIKVREEMKIEAMILTLVS